MRGLKETLENLDSVVSTIQGNPLPLLIRAIGLFESTPEACRLYAETLAETWKEQGLHDLDSACFESLMSQRPLNLLNLDDLNKQLIKALQESGDLEPQVDAEHLFRKVVIKFEAKLRQRQPELMAALLTEATKETEELRKASHGALSQALTLVKTEYSERLEFLEKDVQNLRTLPAPDYLQQHADELYMLRAILQQLFAEVRGLKDSTASTPVLIVNEQKQLAYMNGGEAIALPLSVQDLSKDLLPSALKFPQPLYDVTRDMPSRLLNSEYEMVPFYGREAELKDLLSWANSEKSLT